MAWWHKVQKAYLSGLSGFYGGVAGAIQAVALLSVTVFAVAAVASWGYQGYLWLRSGDWQPLSLAGLFGPFSLPGWTGAEKLLTSMAELNLGIVLILTGWILSLLFRLVATLFESSADEVDDQVKRVRRKEIGLDD